MIIHFLHNCKNNSLLFLYKKDKNDNEQFLRNKITGKCMIKKYIWTHKSGDEKKVDQTTPK